MEGWQMWGDGGRNRTIGTSTFIFLEIEQMKEKKNGISNYFLLNLNPEKKGGDKILAKVSIVSYFEVSVIYS